MPHKNTSKREMLTKTYKFRAYPTGEQESALESQLDEACRLYNAALEERIWAWKMHRKSISYYDQVYQIKPMREDGTIGVASYTAARDVLYRVDLAFQSFFRRLKSGETPGFPRWHSSWRYDSLTWGNYAAKLPDSQHAMLHLRGSHSESVRIRKHRPITGKVKTAQIKRHAGRWWVYLTAECPPPAVLPARKNGIGIYVEPKEERATLSDGRQFYRVPSQKFYQQEMASLDEAQRLRQKSVRGSNRWRKRLVQEQRRHEEVAHRRLDFWHRLSAELVSEHQTIAVGRLPNLREMAEEGHGMEVNDAGWGILMGCLKYKAREKGRDLVEVLARPDDRLSPQQIAQAILREARNGS